MGENYQKLNAALKWLELGAALLPAKFQSKQLIQGFGPYRDRIVDASRAESYFGPGGWYNLAVSLPPGLIGLDFDNDQAFLNWQSSLPTELTTTYHEITRRGWHVFYRCNVPKNLKLIEHVEVKQVLIVSPSVVGGFRYKAIDYPIIEVGSWGDLFSPLLSKDGSSGSALAHSAGTAGPTPAATSEPVIPAAGSDVVSFIKAHIAIYDVALSLTQLVSSDNGAGRWFKGLCPLHKDTRPSFWVDAKRGTWGCHACNKRGDVINLYAESRGIGIQEAIRELIRGVTVG